MPLWLFITLWVMWAWLVADVLYSHHKLYTHNRNRVAVQLKGRAVYTTLGRITRYVVGITTVPWLCWNIWG